MYQRYTLLFLLIISVTSLVSQNNSYPKNYFRSPLDIPLKLSGTFGELRTNHFHSGIDIKTNGEEGAVVYAIADGYISRIKVSPSGFGNALYITHPNGFVSVYGHLKNFMDVVTEYVREEQYNTETFGLNLFPEPDKFPVTKGDTIALSGNSGGSLGPHLHFEIRDDRSEDPINPLLFGFEVKDYIRPKIKSFKIYPYNWNSYINGANEAAVFEIGGWGMQHRINSHDTIYLSGDFYFGISTVDLLNDAPNNNGVYQIEVFLDSTKVYSHKMELFSFGESRYINSLIDYGQYMENGVKYQKSYVEPNNILSVYDGVINRGIISFKDTLTHKLIYSVKDAYGNESRLNFIVQSAIPDSSMFKEQVNEGIFFDYAKANMFFTEDMQLDATEGSFYDSFYFTYDTLPGTDEFYSLLHRVHHKSVAIHKYIELKIQPVNLPDSLQSKALIVELYKDEIFPVGGEYNDGFVAGVIRDFGDFAIAVDTIPPKIKTVNISKGKVKTAGEGFKFKIEDDLSGIRSYRGTINGDWVLMEYDAKNDLLIYYPDDRMSKGENILVLEVVDRKDNATILGTTIIK